MSFAHSMIHKSRRRLVRIISFSVAIAVALAGGVIAASVTAGKYRTQLEYTYERGLSELSEHMSKIETILTKGIYTGTAAGATSLAMNLWSESGSAKACLAQIPTYGTDLNNTYKFLSQVGEYSLSLAKSLRSGKTVSEEEHQQLLTLAQHAKELSQMVDALCGEMSQSGSWKEEIASIVKQQEPREAANTLYTSLQNMEESLSDYPTLLYDGPFSEHILQAKPALLGNQPEITEAQARAKAARVLGVEAAALGDAAVTEKGTIPSYVYYTEGTTVAVTVQGGILNYFNIDRSMGNSALQYEDCVTVAADYLQQIHPGRFQESYYTVSEGICLINFAYVQDDVVCYPDLIKIGVALDNGQIVSYNAQGYIMNHQQRTIEIPTYSLAEAQAVLSPYLTVKKGGKAIIPLNTREPRLCYEFLCTGGEEQQDEILVYVNADTLEEEELLIVLKTDGGTLTI